jgi:hypothetical protein
MSRKRTRESRAVRNAREKAQNRLLRTVGFDPDDPNHLRFDLESTEFALLFTVEGGQEIIGTELVQAFDAQGLKMGTAIAPSLQGLDRGKVAIMSARWEDVEALTVAREQIREERSQMQYQRLMKAYADNTVGWFRHEVPDLEQRAILMGTNHGKDPTIETGRALVCYKVEDHYVVSAETWDGGWSAPNENGERERLGVIQDVVEGITFHSKKEAQEAVLFAVDEKSEGFAEEWHYLANAARMVTHSERLRAWTKNGKDMKAHYRQPSKPEKQKRDKGKSRMTRIRQ